MKAFRLEKIKTAILMMLVLSSMALTYRLWFNDHNLFSILGVFSEDKTTLKYQNGLEYVYSPPRILLNLGENSHTIVTPVDEEYKSLQKEGVKILTQALGSQKYDIANIEEWNRLISSRSVMFGYETNLDTQLLLKLFKVQNANLVSALPQVKEVIIIQDEMVSNNIKCYFKDESQNRLIKVEFKYDDAALNKMSDQLEEKGLGNYVSGYELKHKLLKDNVLLLPMDTEVEGKLVKTENEVNIDSGSQVRNAAQKFFERLNLVKNIEYKDDSKTRVVQKEFIDRKSILRIFSSGIVEYTSAEVPDDKAQVDEYTSLKKAVDFIEGNLEFPQDSYISEVKVLGNSDYIFGFDYFVNGLEVKLDKVGQNRAIEIEVKGGVITSYKRCVKRFEIEKEKKLNVINLKAMDSAIKQYRVKTGKKDIGKTINDIKLVYLDNGTARESYPYWYIDIDGEKFYVYSVGEED